MEEKKPASASLPVDPGQFKIGMRTLAGAVNIITAQHAGHRYGMTATAVCSATAEPPTVLVCINKLAGTHNAVAKGKVFCVNVLRAEDWELSTTFSGGSSGEARFKSRNWTRLVTGSPVLIDALVSFDCHVVKTLAHGTHTIFLGQVEQILIGQKGKPLLYSDGQYAKLASLTLGEPLPEGLDYWGF
jgi:flavin reductase (DIM6/NTAB) family NADH-FMN oxidoreductase RutF